MFDLIETIRLANNRGSAGFRKKNMPGLLFKYFLDMKQVLSECKRVLKPGAWCVLIVGNNVTYADNRSIVIDTDYQLCEIALQLGFLIQEVIPITVTTENMRHINHAIRDNSVIILKSPER
jgi:site-specific DNA-methyltransferase (cytosine-N4-specific)